MNTQSTLEQANFRSFFRHALGASTLFAVALSLLACVFSADPAAEAQMASAPTQAQASQPYVGRYDLYAGYVHFDSPAIGLNEDGFHVQGGVNPRRWLALGADYSSANGSLILVPSELPTAKQAAISAALAQLMAAGIIPSTYVLTVPTDSYTQTFAAGPQWMIRHYPRATFFLRPSVGAIRERATPHPTNAVALLFAQQLAPAGYKIDWTGFYGVGFGTDIQATKHFGLRAQMDFVHDHLFNDLLRDSRNTFRFSIGPSFHFGKNVAK
ncbi:MAG: hypothetical protein ACYCSN_02545 [Acidobacteriaceae bacterium]